MVALLTRNLSHLEGNLCGSLLFSYQSVVDFDVVAFIVAPLTLHRLNLNVP